MSQDDASFFPVTDLLEDYARDTFEDGDCAVYYCDQDNLEVTINDRHGMRTESVSLYELMNYMYKTLDKRIK